MLKTDLVTININNMPASMRRELKIAAARQGRPYNQLILEACDDWLKNWRIIDKERRDEE
jgi:hypothetical protein